MVNLSKEALLSILDLFIEVLLQNFYVLLMHFFYLLQAELISAFYYCFAGQTGCCFLRNLILIYRYPPSTFSILVIESRIDSRFIDYEAIVCLFILCVKRLLLNLRIQIILLLSILLIHEFPVVIFLPYQNGANLYFSQLHLTNTDSLF